MNRKEKFAILGLARTGTTSICNIVNRLFPDLCLTEPFNPVLYGGKYHRRVFECGLEKSLLEILDIYGGIKHVWGNNGWPFVNQESYNDEIFTHSWDKVLVISRRNHLKRIISGAIAKQTNVWHVRRPEDQVRRKETEFSPILPMYVDARLDIDRKLMQNALQRIRQRSFPYLEVEFDSVFNPRRRMLERVDEIVGILSFLDIKTPPAAGAIFGELLNMESQNASQDLYLQIPNIAEIEQKFGSEENGHLFGEV
jgi:hypothetical protein